MFEVTSAWKSAFPGAHAGVLAMRDVVNPAHDIALEKLKAELNAHWEVVSEGAQTILRAAGKSDAYESLKEQTRGRVLTEANYKAWCDSIDVDDATRAKLKALSPEHYIGLAEQLCEQIL